MRLLAWPVFLPFGRRSSGTLGVEGWEGPRNRDVVGECIASCAFFEVEEPGTVIVKPPEEEELRLDARGVWTVEVEAE
jgi:hypothetical protein